MNFGKIIKNTLRALTAEETLSNIQQESTYIPQYLRHQANPSRDEYLYNYWGVGNPNFVNTPICGSTISMDTRYIGVNNVMNQKDSHSAWDWNNHDNEDVCLYCGTPQEKNKLNCPKCGGPYKTMKH